MSEPRLLMKNKEIDELVACVGDAIISGNKDRLGDIVFVGIITAGFPLANRLSHYIETKAEQSIPVGKLDVSLYRDDLLIRSDYVTMKESDIPFNISDKILILVDDVLFHGRTVRAALNTLLDFGRPERIELAVLIDRGFRQLPIFAHYVGQKMETDPDDHIKVKLLEIYGEEGVFLEKTEKKEAPTK